MTWRNVDSGPAPRSKLASSSVWPIPTKRARTISITIDVLNTTWAIRMVSQPSWGKTPTSERTWTKKISVATAITISGTTSVR